MNKARISKQVSLLSLILYLVYFLVYEEEAKISYEKYLAHKVYSSQLNKNELIIQEEIFNFKIDAEKRGYNLTNKINNLKFSVESEIRIPISRVLKWIFIQDKQLPLLDGLCINEDYIQISAEAMENLTRSQIKSLVYHELAHCLMDLDHNSDPNNIMYERTNPYRIEDRQWWRKQINFIFP